MPAARSVATWPLSEPGGATLAGSAVSAAESAVTTTNASHEPVRTLPKQPEGVARVIETPGRNDVKSLTLRGRHCSTTLNEQRAGNPAAVRRQHYSS
jgi:hypothetical protein